MMSPHRTTAAVVALVGIVAFVVVALLRVPWDPVPGGPVATPSADAVFDAGFLAGAEHYSTWARVWSWSSLAVSLAVACLVGFSRRARALVDRLPGPWWARVVLAVVALAVLGRVLTLPFGLALLDLRVDEGLSTQTRVAWAGDVVRSEGIAIVVTALVLLLLLGTARRWPRRWPAVAGLVTGLFVLGASYVYPVVVEPMFNDFTPLEAGELRTDIFALADEEGVEIDDVLVADASRRTTTLNAYVSGFGHTRRVVVYDTLVGDLPRDQALSVVAHELAHARHGDVVTGSLLGAAGAVTGVGLLGLLVGAGAANRRRTTIGDPTVVPLVLALVAIAGLLSSPLQNAVSRRIETRADVGALQATQDREAFIGMQVRLAERSLSDPTPPALSQWWFGSHPTTLQRIGVAEQVLK